MVNVVHAVCPSYGGDTRLFTLSLVPKGETPALTLVHTDTPVQRKRISPFDTVDCQKKKLTSRYVTVCLGVLCAVLLAGNIGQLVYCKSYLSSNCQLAFNV